MGCMEAISANEAHCARAPKMTITIPQARASGPPLVSTAVKFLATALVPLSDERNTSTYKAWVSQLDMNVNEKKNICVKLNRRW